MIGTILAGGKSSRFGTDKALVAIDGSTLIERSIEFLGRFFEKLAIVTNDPEKFGFIKNVRIVQDVVTDIGPVGGIYSALVTLDDKIFAMACDMPCGSETLVQEMIQQAEQVDVVVPRYDSRIEATFAIYSRNCIEPFEKNIKAGDYQVRSIFPEVKTKYTDISELGLGPDIFFNINTPRDLKRFLTK